MSVNDYASSTKTNFSKMKSPIYFSPYAHKKKGIGNLFTEPRNIPMQSDSSSKITTKQKISNKSLTKNIINLEPQECFRRSTKYLSNMNDKSYLDKNSMPQSFKKINSKLYLKKNAIPNLSSFNENSNYTYMTQYGTNSNMNSQVNSRNNKLLNKDNKPGNMKINTGKNNINSYANIKESSHHLQKSAGSALELFGNNMIKKAKTKSKKNTDLNNININPINPIGYILTTTGNNNRQFLSPHGAQGQKIIILKKEKNNLKDKYIGNLSKDSLKIIQTQGNEQINNNNLDDKDKNNIQYLLRNTYNNVKIYPTTVLNNKIIYQTENKNNINNIDNDNSHIHILKNKSEKLMFNKANKKGNFKINPNYENANSIEEVHFLYVSIIQKGKNLIVKLDKYNK